MACILPTILKHAFPDLTGLKDLSGLFPAEYGPEPIKLRPERVIVIFLFGARLVGDLSEGLLELQRPLILLDPFPPKCEMPFGGFRIFRRDDIHIQEMPAGIQNRTQRAEQLPLTFQRQVVNSEGGEYAVEAGTG
jgi:hypothetical protein